MTRTKKRQAPVSGWLIVGLLLTQLACKTVMGGVVPVATPTALPTTARPSPSAMPPDKSGPEQGHQTGKTSELTPPYLPSSAPGIACIGTQGFGITCLENGEWHTHSEATGNIVNDYILAITGCPDGSVLAAHSSGLGRYNHQEWRSYEKGWGVSSAEALACGAENDIWVAHFRGVSHFDGLHWQTYPATEHLLGAAGDPELLNDLAITTAGDVWAVTANSVAWFAQGEWQVFAEGAGFDERQFFANVALDAQGRPWVSASQGLFVFDGLMWTPFPKDRFSSPTALAVDAQGQVWVGTASYGLYVLHQDGSWSNYNRTNSRLSSDHVRDIVIDGQGRVWIGTVWGLNVLAEDVWYTYRMDNSGLADQDIGTLVVVNGGPALPEPHTKVPGSLSGKIVDEGGNAVAHAAIDLCVEKLYQDAYDTSPCADQPFYHTATTDAEGNFSFTDVPMGRYVLAVNDDGLWRRVPNERGTSYLQVLVTARENTDVGEVTLKEKR
ncbi:MAG TPA: carboxypeptidase regulatory-like domain-containing protein [Anaerolineae bacterium]|nr:carboxypeptidase regulatory-like domain-containing protein [Anaerolineae bacterium]